MSDHILTFTCEPGTATVEKALEIQSAVMDALNAIADDIEPGAVTFKTERFEWIDDGKDEIVIRVKAVPHE